MEIRNPSPGLYNEDLAPAKERNWGAFSIFNVWTSDVHSLWGYYLAASLFLLCGSFTYGERAPLEMPIHVFGGKQDSVRADQLLDWQLDAASGFSLDMFDGHHFFLMQHESAVLRCVRRYAAEHLARWRNGAARQLVTG